MDGALSNVKKWNIIYPVYMNSRKTIAQGRRISASKACENPTCIEIVDCCNHLKIPNAIELDKAYPRDFMQRGRVRVLLKKEDGSLNNPAIGSSKNQKAADAQDCRVGAPAPWKGKEAGTCNHVNCCRSFKIW